MFSSLFVIDKVEVLEPDEQLPKDCETDELGSQSTVREVELLYEAIKIISRISYNYNNLSL